MIDIPSHVRIGVALERGSVYYIKDGDELSSYDPHYYVLLNSPEDSMRILLLVIASSKVEKRRDAAGRRGWAESTLVVVPLGAVSFLSKETVFDCNYVSERTKEELVAKLENGELTFKTAEKMPGNVLAQLTQAVLESTFIRDEIKDVLRKYI